LRQVLKQAKMQERETNVQELQVVNGGFHYTYSAPEQQEVRKIREKYLPREESKLDQLRRLDESATKKAMALSLMTGTLSSLVLGIGMCLTMVWGGWLFVPGIAVGILGIVGVATAYPLYSKVTQRERERIAPEILRLTDELMK